ncbi:MAG: citryl-CoA lyase [Anaerolineae bacterium]|nr:citryl-CoA lyase [Anaerolineae bacterium]
MESPASKSARKSDDLHWSTAITAIQPNEIRLRGYRIDELMGDITFSQAIYLALTGHMPTDAIGKIIDAIFVSSIDHGASPPSTLAARTVASTGAPLNAAVAAGILSINKHHGGAIQACIEMVQDVLNAVTADHTIDQSAADLVASYKQSKQRLPGFGHRVHTSDPRTARLLGMADELGLAKDGIAAIRALETALTAQSNSPLPINVDGAIAAILYDIGITAELGNAFFMIARLPGLVAQVQEERTRERPMRQIHPSDHDYDGPAPR